MKKLASIVVYVCGLALAAKAQLPAKFQWNKEGNSYYAIRQNRLYKFNLPSFDSILVLDTLQLIPAGETRALTIKDFSVTDDGLSVLIYTNSKRVWRRETRGDYWILNRAEKSLKQLGKDKPASSLMFAKLSPDGTKAAYVSGHNIYAEDLATNKVTPLTTNGTDRMINGTFDWAYEEEFGCRDGFRWSPDSKSIAFWQVDATSIRNFLLINNTDSLYSFTIPVEYPKAGQDPSPAKIGVVNVATGNTTWMNVPGDPVQHYIPRMEWADNSSEVILEQLNRKQNEAKVFICNAGTGIAKQIYSETDKAWIDVKDSWSEDPTGWEWLNAGKEFLWVSEKDGWRHLYRINRDGDSEVKITNGNYDIVSIKGIDKKKGIVYFTASPLNATQVYLYSIPVKGNKDLTLLSPAGQKGTHNYNVSPTGLYASHTFSNISDERASEWISLPGHKSIRHFPGPARGAATTTAARAEIFSITTGDGISMDGWMVKPKNFDSTKKYPVLFMVYGEPASATVKDAAGVGTPRVYSGDMAADGYIYISLDGRGSPAPKGAAWRKAIYRNIGIVNVHDQAMAARKIMQWPFVDTSRIAVWGWSGGGSTTLNLMFQFPEIYKTGISIAPVANQLLYDNIYQERFMGLPQETRQDYLNGSPLSHAKNLRGNLLVIHGTGDDNVHYQGTEMLINELIRQGKFFEMMSYPNRTHSINEGEGTSKHLALIFTNYLKEHCPPGPR